MKKKLFFANRLRKQALMWPVLPTVIIVGWLYPPAGFALFLCMLGAVGLSFFRGRSWCDWMCPRGSFYDVFFQRFNQGKPIPAWLRSKTLRIFMLCLIFTSIFAQFYFAWGDLSAMGLALVRLLTFTTLVGIVLAVFVHPRGWCHICPMGTLAGWFGKGKEPLCISSECTGCGLCSKSCPMGLTPNADRESGKLRDSDCIKCGSCTAVCPLKVLSFENVKESQKNNHAA